MYEEKNTEFISCPQTRIYHYPKNKKSGLGAEPQTNGAVWAYYPLARIVVLISPKSKGKNARSKRQQDNKRTL